MPKGTFQECCWQCPNPHADSLPTHASTRDFPTLAVRVGSVFCGTTAPFPCVLVWARFCLCSQEWSLYLLCKSFVSPVIKFFLPSMSDSLGIPSLFARFPCWEDWSANQNLHNSGRTLVFLFSSLWVSHLLGIGFYFMVIASILLSCCSVFVFGYGVSVFWWVPASFCQLFFNS